MQKTRWEKTVNKDYLGAYSLDNGNGYESLVVKILNVSIGEVKSDRGKEQATIAHLENQKPMILNRTNMKTLTRLFKSPYIEDWAGKRVKIVVKNIRAFGENVDCLRFDNKLPDLPELTPNHKRWEGAKQSLKDGNTTIEAIKKHFKLSKENETLLCNNSK